MLAGQSGKRVWGGALRCCLPEVMPCQFPHPLHEDLAPSCLSVCPSFCRSVSCLPICLLVLVLVCLPVAVCRSAAVTPFDLYPLQAAERVRAPCMCRDAFRVIAGSATRPRHEACFNMHSAMYSILNGYSIHRVVTILRNHL